MKSVVGLGREWAYRESRIDDSRPVNGGGICGVIEAATARKWGYHSPFEPESDDEKGGDPPCSPREMEDYTGRSAKTGKPIEGRKGGCVGVAQAEIFGEEGLKLSLQYLEDQ
ncbi:MULTISPECIES: hypothetical protein [unclassified Streptomyces]|uniref:hypothetical protein n=1 Tax=unclassified Streptomyces TaxID=2593676 RepID=UPI00166162C7|nr:MULTISPECIES: hypothetical protein [unclassified Streptomyces]